MDEQKNGFSAILRQPLIGPAHYQRSVAPVPDGIRIGRLPSIKQRPRNSREGLETERAVVEIKPLVEAHLPLQKDGPDKRARLVSMRLKDTRQRDRSHRNTLAILFDPVFKWISRREERIMRRQRQWNLALRAGEERSALGERIDIRRL